MAVDRGHGLFFIRVKGINLAEIRLAGVHQRQAVGARFRLGLFVGQDHPGRVFLQADEADETLPIDFLRQRPGLGRREDRRTEFFLQEIKPRLRGANQNFFFLPGRIESRRAGVPVVPGMVLGGLFVQDQTNRVPRMPLIKSVLLLRRDDIVGRGDNLAEVVDLLGVVAETPEGNDMGHFKLSFWISPQSSQRGVAAIKTISHRGHSDHRVNTKILNTLKLL